MIRLYRRPQEVSSGVPWHETALSTLERNIWHPLIINTPRKVGSAVLHYGPSGIQLALFENRIGNKNPHAEISFRLKGKRKVIRINPWNKKIPHAELKKYTGLIDSKTLSFAVKAAAHLLKTHAPK